MDPIRCYNSENGPKRCATRARNSDIHRLLSTPQYPCSNKSRQYMLKLIYMNMPMFGRRKISFKFSGPASALRPTRSPLESYEQSSAAFGKRECSLQNRSFETTSLDYSRNLNRKLHKTANQSFLVTQGNKFPDDPGRQLYFQKPVPPQKKPKNRSRQYAFHTAQNVRKSHTTDRIDSKVEQSAKIVQAGKEELKKSEYEKAIKHFDQAYRINSMNIEALLYKGIALMDNNKPVDAIKVLKEVINQKPDTKSAYLLLAIGYKKTNDIQSAINTLNLVLQRVDKTYLEAIMSRANLHVFAKKWKEAKADFQTVLKITPNNVPAHLGIAECEEKLGNSKKALEAYETVFGINPNIPLNTWLKKAKLELKLRDYSKALTSVELILEKYNNNPEVCMLKGTILQKQNHIEDAALHYEQAAKNEDPRVASKALFKLAKMRLREQDYYEACFDIRRAFQYPSPNRKMEIYKTLIDGIVSLMKKKNKAGLKYLISLEDEIEKLKSDIQFVYHVFKGYGYTVHHQFEVLFKNGLKEYETSENIKTLDEAAVFNKHICEGAVAITLGKYDSALEFFSKSISIFPHSKEGYIYRFLAYVACYLSCGETEYTSIKWAEDELELALDKSRKDAELHYYKGIIQVSQHQYMEALQEFNKAIKYADESTARHYFAKGFCEACLNMFKEAMEDLDIVIKLDPNYTDGYLIKAGDTNTAFMCYQQLIMLNKDEPIMHIHAGNLLMATGAIEDAIKAFTNANELKETSIGYYQQAKCFIMIGDLANAFMSIIQASKLDSHPILAKDAKSLQILLKMQDPGNFAEALDSFAQFIESIKEDPKVSNLSTSSLNEVPIPSIYSHADILRAYDYPIFSLEDWVAYSAILHFYLANYQEALDALRMLEKVLLSHKKTYFDSDMSVAMDPALTLEIYEFRFSPMTFNECYYNLLLCCLLLGDLEGALEMANKMLDTVKPQSLCWITLLRFLIYEALGKKDKAAKDLKTIKAKKSEVDVEILNESKSIQVEFGRTKDTLAENFPFIEITIGTYKIKARPSFTSPMVRPMNMLPMAGDFVLSQLHPKKIQCQPEPPWIKRCTYGIKFTDEIQLVEDLDFGEESDKNESKEDSENEDAKIEDSKPVESKKKIKANSTGKIATKTLLT